MNKMDLKGNDLSQQMLDDLVVGHYSHFDVDGLDSHELNMDDVSAYSVADFEYSEAAFGNSDQDHYPPTPPPDYFSATTRYDFYLDEYERKLMDEAEELEEKTLVTELEIVTIKKECDVAKEDRKNAELAYANVQKKIERFLEPLEHYQANQEILKERDAKLMARVEYLDMKFEETKVIVKKTIEEMYKLFEARVKEVEDESSKIRAIIRKNTMKAESLQNEVEQKGREILKLSLLCDDLISGNKINYDNGDKK